MTDDDAPRPGVTQAEVRKQLDRAFNTASSIVLARWGLLGENTKLNWDALEDCAVEMALVIL